MASLIQFTAGLRRAAAQPFRLLAASSSATSASSPVLASASVTTSHSTSVFSFLLPTAGRHQFFSSSAMKAAPPVRSSKKKGHQDKDPKMKILDKALYKMRFVPPPLRMGRNRYLRHWTIHRAWMLFRRQNRDLRERELMQQYQSMYNACEELRKTAGPGRRDLGYLYRVAMEKKGVWRHGGVPIEYARPQTETPAVVAWNHEWTP